MNDLPKEGTFSTNFTKCELDPQLTYNNPYALCLFVIIEYVGGI